MILQSLRQRMLISLGLGVAVMLALSVYGDLPTMARTFGVFRWEYLPIILILTLGNYLLRFVKWQYYLGLIGAGNISRRRSLLVFFSGLSMVITPGKVGEWLKSFLLREVNGTPISLSAPIVVAERLTDGMAMTLLATAGLIVYAYAWEVMLLIFLATVVVLAVIQWRALALRLLSLSGRLPIVSRRVDSLHRFYESSYVLLGGKSLLLAIGIGLVSWFGECVAFFFVLMGLGLEPSLRLLMQATFILATSTVIASVAFVPGGLAVAEGSIAGLLMVLGLTSEPAVAAAATLLIRLCTLWFGVAVGVGALLRFSRELGTLGPLRSDGQVSFSAKPGDDDGK